MTAIRDLKDGDSVDATFAVAGRDVRKTRNGESYVTMNLRDVSGGIRLIKFHYDPAMEADFASANAVAVRGRVETFNNLLQIKADAIEPVRDLRFDPESLIPASPQDPRELLAALREIHAGLANDWLRRLLQGFLDDESFVATLQVTPAAQMMHHSYKGGLLEHIVSVTRLALKICEHYPVIDRDLLVAGVFFHDIGKTRELALGLVNDYTDEGRLLGHITIGVGMIEDRCRAIEDFPAELKMHLQHLVLSHHGRLEYGSPRLPMTLEAIVLHYVDNIDAKIWSYLDAVNKTREDQHWTEYTRAFDSRLYIPESRRQSNPKS